MRYILERVSNPEIEPVTLAEMKLHLRTFGTDTTEDDKITGLIVAAREWAEDYTGRALVDQTWRLTLLGNRGVSFGGDTVGGFRGPGPVNFGYYAGEWNFGRLGEIHLHKAPVLALSSFVSIDSAGTETAVDASTYELREANSKWPRLVAINGASWSTWLTGDLRITYRAGFADRTSSPQTGAEVVPSRFKQAIMLYGEALYDRDPVMMEKLITAAESLMKPEMANLGLA